MKTPLSCLFYKLPISVGGVAGVYGLMLCCLVFATCPALCQDIITRTDSVQIPATILKVESETIRYKLHQEPEGPDYVISTLDVLFVDYADGTRKVFGQPVARQQMKPETDYTTDWGRNILTISIDDFLHYSATLSYERIFASGKVGIRVPLSVGLNPTGEDMGSHLRNKTFSAGIGVNFYPFGQARFNYYLGPQVELSSIKYNTYYYGPYDPDMPTQSQIKSFQTASVILSNGVYYQFTKSFIAALDIGVGARVWKESVGSDYRQTPYSLSTIYIPSDLRIGFRF